jgi:hypothetical protein
MLKPRPIHVSALTGAGVDEVLPFAVRIGQAYRVRLPTPELAAFVGGVVARSAPPRESRFVTLRRPGWRRRGSRSSPAGLRTYPNRALRAERAARAV